MKQTNGDNQQLTKLYPHLLPLLPPHLQQQLHSLPPTTVNATLQQLDHTIQQRQQEVQLHIQSKQHQIKLQQQKTEKYEKLLSLIGLSPNDLQHHSPSKQYSTDNVIHQLLDTTTALATITQLLSSPTYSISSLFPTIISLRSSLYEHELQYQQLNYKTIKLKQHNNKLEIKLQHLTDVHQHTLSEHNNKHSDLQHAKSTTIPTMRLKSIEYQTDYKQLMNEIVESGYREEYRHESIVQRHEEVNELETHVGSLRQRLRAYSDLPADMQLAELKLAESQYRLKQLDDKLTALIDKQMSGG